MTEREQQKQQLRELIRESRVADRWGKSRRTIQRWRASGRMPPHVRLGASIAYFVDDMVAHEEALLSAGNEG
jgi:predicted DNA-binding transcriptional regulator AlpA